MVDLVISLNTYICRISCAIFWNITVSLYTSTQTSLLFELKDFTLLVKCDKITFSKIVEAIAEFKMEWPK